MTGSPPPQKRSLYKHSSFNTQGNWRSWGGHPSPIAGDGSRYVGRCIEARATLEALRCLVSFFSREHFSKVKHSWKSKNYCTQDAVHHHGWLEDDLFQKHEWVAQLNISDIFEASSGSRTCSSTFSPRKSSQHVHIFLKRASTNSDVLCLPPYVFFPERFHVQQQIHGKSKFTIQLAAEMYWLTLENIRHTSWLLLLLKHSFHLQIPRHYAFLIYFWREVEGWKKDGKRVDEDGL